MRPLVYLSEVGRQLKGSDIQLGAQSVCAEPVGAFTGEISAGMLKDLGCSYVIVGHSERRAIFKESDALVARKFVAAQTQGLTPICVSARRWKNAMPDRRLPWWTGSLPLSWTSLAYLHSSGQSWHTSLSDREIGTGKNATPQQAQDVHQHIRAALAGRDARIAGLVRVLYGGSVKAVNAAELFAMADVDGGLVGGASLNAREFVGICKAVQG